MGILQQINIRKNVYHYITIPAKGVAIDWGKCSSKGNMSSKEEGWQKRSSSRVAAEEEQQQSSSRGVAAEEWQKGAKGLAKRE